MESSTCIDIRTVGIGHSLDLIMYVLYSGDQKFIKDMVHKATMEIIDMYQVDELKIVLEHKDNLLLYKCLFFFVLDFHQPFRYWVLQDANIGLYQVCPYKARRFLKVLRDEIIPSFLVNEGMRLDELEYRLKEEYVRS